MRHRLRLRPKKHRKKKTVISIKELLERQPKLVIPLEYNKYNPKYKELVCLVWDYNNGYLPIHKIERLLEFIELFKNIYRGERIP